MQPRQKKNATVDKTVASGGAAEGTSNVLPSTDAGKDPSIVDELRGLWKQKSAIAHTQEEGLKEQVASANQAFVRAVARDAGPQEVLWCEARIGEANRALNQHRAEWRKTEAPILHALRLAGGGEKR